MTIAIKREAVRPQSSRYARNAVVTAVKLAKRLAALVVAATLAVFPLLVGQSVTAWSQEQPAQAERSQPFSIIVALLKGDADGTQAAFVIRHLKQQLGGSDGKAAVDIQAYPEALETGEGVPPTVDARTNHKGQEWLKRKNANLLVWGSVSAKDKMLRLRFLARDDDGSAYAMSDGFCEKALEMPIDFDSDLARVLAVFTATRMPAVGNRKAAALVELVAPLILNLRPIAQNPPTGFDNRNTVQLWDAYARGEQSIGSLKGDKARLKTAVIYFRKVIEVWTREKTPSQWALTQNNLGNTLYTLGIWDHNTVWFDEAITAYRAAMQERTRERAPLQWASTQINIGNALTRFGMHEASTARFAEAVAAYRAALQERRLETVPGVWAQTQASLGTALSWLGQRESGVARYTQALAAFRAAQRVYTRDKEPLQWARMQMNVGGALLALGQRKNDTALFVEAIATFRNALELYPRESRPNDWASTMKTIAFALRALGERERGSGHLAKAVAAYRAVLEVRTPEMDMLQWALTQNDLGVTLLALGKRGKDTVLLTEAVTAFRAAVGQFSQGFTAGNRLSAQNDLGTALLALGELQVRNDRRQGCTTLHEAREPLVAALDASRKMRANVTEEQSKGNLKMVDATIARLGCGRR